MMSIVILKQFQLNNLGPAHDMKKEKKNLPKKTYFEIKMNFENFELF